jgi:uncharacterized protein (DUF2249 family)
MDSPHLHLNHSQTYFFDARGIAKRFRHAAIFGALDALRPGETMRFCNDHDPLQDRDRGKEPRHEAIREKGRTP